jgi:hypothetical protein
VSEENVEVILRFGDALNLHEPTEEDFAPFVTPDWTGTNVATAVTDKTYHGTAGMVQWLKDLTDVFAEGVRIDGGVVADGADFVVSWIAIIGKGAGSEAPLTLRFASLNWFEGDRVRRTVGYARVSEALKAVGLEQ